MTAARVAAVQMVSAPEVGPNLEAAGRLVAAAAAAGARLVALPENFYLIGRDERDKVRAREAEGAGPIQQFLSEAAKKNGVWIVGGTAPISCGDAGRIRSACLVYDDAGRRVARYDKMHLFRFEHGAERYDESRTLEPGSGAVALASPFGRLAGTHPSGRRTYGHTMIIDPWGEILGVRPEGEGVVLAEIDPERPGQLRRRFH